MGVQLGKSGRPDAGGRPRDAGLDSSCPAGAGCMIAGPLTDTRRRGRHGMGERWGLYHTKRAATCAALLDELRAKRVLLLHAPFAAGKSSMLEVWASATRKLQPALRQLLAATRIWPPESGRVCVSKSPVTPDATAWRQDQSHSMSRL